MNSSTRLSSSQATNDGHRTTKKQQTLSSFFFTAKSSNSISTSTTSKHLHSHSHSQSQNKTTTGLDANHPIDIDNNKFCPNRPILTKKPSLLLFESQGSFDEECDPDAEINNLLNTPKLNNFKSLKPKLSTAPILQRSSSSISYHVTEIDTDNDNNEDVASLREYTKVSSGSRQLSFTSNNKFQGSQSSILTQSTQRPTVKRSLSPTRTPSFQGLKLASATSKRIKPITRKNSSLASSSSSSFKNNSSLSSIKLTKEQETVVDLIVKRRLNVFYTGSAGTGKSVILKTIIRQLRMLYGKEEVAITASTGLAATTIGGSTLHKWAGVGLATQHADMLVNRIKNKKDVYNVWRNTRVLIIDEISMVDGLFLNKLEYIARVIRRSDKPFGGIQLVFTGDFFQLPPVAKRDAKEVTMFCFESSMWKRCIQKTLLLNKVFRQQDGDLVSILNSIRFGEVNDEMIRTIRKLSREVKYDDGIDPTELYATRREVEQSNIRQLRNLPGKKYLFNSIDIGAPEHLKLLDSSLMVEKQIILKEDAQIMMLRNKPEVDLVNGSLGKVLFFTTEKLLLKMKELYGSIDDELVADMRLISQVIGNRRAIEDKTFRQDLQCRPSNRLEILETMINYAIEEDEKVHVYPFVRWTIGKNKYYHDIVLQERFPVDIPGDKVGLERSQLPIMLCWALSIHKSQGQTIQRLKVDLRNIFEAGQVYVALSRAVSQDQLQVLNFNPSRIRADDKVKEFYKHLETV